MTDLSALITPLTPDSVEANALALAASAGLPTATQAWQSGTVPRTLIKIHAAAQADESQTIANIASGAFTELAQDAWADGNANSWYNLQRSPATAAVRMFALTAATGAGPYTIAAGQLTLQTVDGLQWTNLNGGTVPAGSTLWNVQFAASTYGSVGNTVLATSPVALLTPLAGVTVQCVIQSGTTSNIVTPGSDAESDAMLALRCQGRWATLGSGANDLSYSYYALSSGALTVSRAQVAVDRSTPGQVLVYLAPPPGASQVSDADLALVQSVLSAKAPLCVNVVALKSPVFAFTFGAQIKIRSAFLATSSATIQAGWGQYGASIPIGGTIEPNRLVAIAEDAPGVVSVIVTDGTSQLSQTPMAMPPGFVAQLSAVNVTFVAA